jgi:protein-S-isoprenylcysteine O-methyltransferase Ste14
MFLAWFSYFFISFNDPNPVNLSGYNNVGLFLIVVGFYLFLVSHARVHKRMHSGKGVLVRDGIYKYLRHPMYLGEIFLLIGAPVFGQGFLTFLLSPVFIIQILVWRYFEEKELTEEFPEYRDYKKKTWF